MTATFHVGDALTVLETLPDDSADLVLTSPPFLALRSYLPADHPEKHLEMGSESDPGAFVDALMRVVVELRRVLAPHGSMVIELGDTYAGSGGAGGEAWPLAKSLALIPQTLALTLAYGRNPHTGQEYEPWRIRNIIRWVRPNPPVGALGDKFRPATSELIVACVSDRRYFDLDAVRKPHQTDPGDRAPQGPRPINTSVRPEGTGGQGTALGAPSVGKGFVNEGNPAGAPPLDWWNIPTHPYKGAHYATFPPELCLKPIKAMCPERVCRECGEPSRRITTENTNRGGRYVETTQHGGQRAPGSGDRGGSQFATAVIDTVGWSDCGHNNWRPGRCLDPFAGTGTVLQVATGHSRDAIGIDLDPRNADLALERVGPLMLEIVNVVRP